MVVNYKTDSTENMICKKHWWLEQPILGVFSTACINTCTLPWAKPSPFSLALPSPSSSQSILCIYRLGSRGSAKWFSLAWKHTLLTWWHFSPMAISSQEWQADVIHPAGSSSTRREAPRTHRALCTTWQLPVAQLSRSADVKQHMYNSHSSTDTAALERSCSCGYTMLFYSQVFLCR